MDLQNSAVLLAAENYRNHSQDGLREKFVVARAEVDLAEVVVEYTLEECIAAVLGFDAVVDHTDSGRTAFASEEAK
jgi:hypothetical protein